MKNRGTPHEIAAANEAANPQQLFERYGHHIENKELDEAQAKEFLSALWKIMVAFVDLGFNVKAGDKLYAESDIGMDDVLNYLCREDTAPETVASPKPTNKKEPR